MISHHSFNSHSFFSSPGFARCFIEYTNQRNIQIYLWIMSSLLDTWHTTAKATHCFSLLAVILCEGEKLHNCRNYTLQRLICGVCIKHCAFLTQCASQKGAEKEIVVLSVCASVLPYRLVDRLIDFCKSFVGMLCHWLAPLTLEFGTGTLLATFTLGRRRHAFYLTF